MMGAAVADACAANASTGGDAGGAARLAGVLSLGVGDAAAAAVGLAAARAGLALTWGALYELVRGAVRRRGQPARLQASNVAATWPGASKTMQGSAACALACAGALAALHAAFPCSGVLPTLPHLHARLLAVGTVIAAVETTTGSLDNLTLPLAAWLAIVAAGLG